MAWDEQRANHDSALRKRQHRRVNGAARRCSSASDTRSPPSRSQAEGKLRARAFDTTEGAPVVGAKAFLSLDYGGRCAAIGARNKIRLLGLESGGKQEGPALTHQSNPSWTVARPEPFSRPALCGAHSLRHRSIPGQSIAA